MTPQSLATYHRARWADIPARSALAIARSADDDPGELPMSWDQDGFTLTAAASPDEYITLDDLGYGRFLAGAEDWRTGYSRRPDPDAVPNPYRDSRNPSGGAAWYVPGEAGTLRERADGYRAMGYARGPAWDRARESINDELRTVAQDYGPAVYVVTVTASRAGIELAHGSIGGVEIAWDDITRTSGDRYLVECARDLAPEVIEEARDALARLAVPA